MEKMNSIKLYSSKAIANEFIRLARDKGKAPLTHMQLQKLVYFSHVIALVFYKSPLVKDGFQAWPFGPVNFELYFNLKGYGKNGIETFLDLDKYKEEIEKDSKVMKIIKDIYENMGQLDGWTLSQLTHQKGAPWSNAYEEGKSNIINDGDIIYFYDQLLNTK